jgi:hypothetical protein
MSDPSTSVGPEQRPLTALLESIGTRARRRGEPRTTISVAGAGCALAVLGVLLVSGDAGFGDGGGFNRWPGTILAALVVLGGLLAMRTVARGPVGTAGAVAVFLGLPVLAGFVTLDPDSFPPFSVDGILVITTVGWLAAYVAGPGKGRPVFLGGGLVGVWLSVIQVTEQPFDFPFFVFGFMSFDSDDDFFGASIHEPDLFVIGIVSLAIGIAYGLATRWCDSRGHHGVATPFAVATIPAVALGIGAFGDDLGATVTGLLYVAAGVALAHQGATLGRRATSWIGALTIVNGVGMVVIDAARSPATAGLLLMLVGLCVVWASQLASERRHEPADTQLTGGVRPFRRPKPAVTTVD